MDINEFKHTIKAELAQMGRGSGTWSRIAARAYREGAPKQRAWPRAFAYSAAGIAIVGMITLAYTGLKGLSPATGGEIDLTPSAALFQPVESDIAIVINTCFEEMFAAIEANPELQLLSNPYAYIADEAVNPHYEAIIALGQDAVPVLEGMLEDPANAGLKAMLIESAIGEINEGLASAEAPKTTESSNEDHNAVSWKEPAVESIIRAAIGKPKGDIYRSELDYIWSIDITRDTVAVNDTPVDIVIGPELIISSLDDIANMRNLTFLGISNHGVTDVEALKYTKKIEHLILSFNNISDCTVIATLPNLCILDLSYNNISDISPVSGLANLWFLSFAHNNISDISPVAQLENLQSLYISNNQISDISALSNLDTLNGLLIDNNSISDISIVGNLTHLTDLDISGLGITDISMLGNLPELQVLTMDNNPIEDISVLKNLRNLHGVSISGIGVRDVSVLANLLKLSFLYADDNHISDLSAISGLTKLETLSISGNDIRDISALKGLETLYHLNLSKNSIRDFTALYGITRLYNLYLYDTGITDAQSAELEQALPDCNIEYVQYGNN